jgi:hypothetical protein
MAEQRGEMQELTNRVSAATPAIPPARPTVIAPTAHDDRL